MRLLDRYLLRQLLFWLTGCVFGFLILWVAFDLMQQLNKLLELKLTGLEIAQYYVILAPKFLIIVLPIGLLLALLMMLTTLARHNEIIAMRAAGISLWRLAVPLFGVGFACSIFLFVVNEFWVPDCENRAEAIKNRHVGNPAYPDEGSFKRDLSFNNERDGRNWQHIRVYDLKTGEMTDVEVTWAQSDGSRWQLYAERAMPTNGGWLFSNVHEFVDAQENGQPPVPVLQTNALFMPFATETPRSIAAEIKMARRISDLSTKELDVPVFEISDYLRFHPDPRHGRGWLYTQYDGRLAAPWACLVVVLIALPFGAVSGRRNVTVGVASAIFICFAFYALQQVGLALGSGSFVPAWLAGWLPILLFGGIGLWLTARAR